MGRPDAIQDASERIGLSGTGGLRHSTGNTARDILQTDITLENEDKPGHDTCSDNKLLDFWCAQPPPPADSLRAEGGCFFGSPRIYSRYQSREPVLGLNLRIPRTTQALEENTTAVSRGLPAKARTGSPGPWSSAVRHLPGHSSLTTMALGRTTCLQDEPSTHSAPAAPTSSGGERCPGLTWWGGATLSI